MYRLWKKCIVTPLCHPIFYKTNMLYNDLKKMQSMSLEYNVEHQSLYGSNFRDMGAPCMLILEKKSD